MRSLLWWIAVSAITLGLYAPNAMAQASVLKCSRGAPENCLDGVGSGVASLDSLRVNLEVDLSGTDDESVEGQASLDDRLRTRAAGDGLSGWSVWGGYTYSDFESVTRAPYEATLNNFVIGADTLYTDNFLFGLFAGYESLDVDTTFNGGGQDVDGFSIGPYFAYLFNDTFSADGVIGYTRLETDQDRIDPADASTLSVDFGANRVFLAMNFNAVHYLGDVVLSGRAGYQYAQEEQDAYSEGGGGPSARTVGERGLTLGQAYIGGDIAYGLGDFEPYAHGVYRYDVTTDDGADAGGLPGAFGNPQPQDPDEVQWGLGVRYFGPSGISGQFEWVSTVGRELFDENSFNLLVRLDF